VARRRFPDDFIHCLRKKRLPEYKSHSPPYSCTNTVPARDNKFDRLTHNGHLLFVDCTARARWSTWFNSHVAHGVVSLIF